MPNHTMFLKYSRKRETRGQSCQSSVSAFREEGQPFYFPSPAHGVRAGSRTGYVTAFLSTILRDSNVPSSLSGEGGSLGSEVCAYHRGQVWKPPEMIPWDWAHLSWAVSSGRGSDTHVMSKLNTKQTKFSLYHRCLHHSLADRKWVLAIIAEDALKETFTAGGAPRPAVSPHSRTVKACEKALLRLW